MRNQAFFSSLLEFPFIRSLGFRCVVAGGCFATGMHGINAADRETASVAHDELEYMDWLIEPYKTCNIGSRNTKKYRGMHLTPAA